jgi:cytochrome P450
MTTKVRDAPKQTLLSDIFYSDLPPSDRKPFVLEQEAVRYIAAGTGSTARCVENAIFYILSNPVIKTKLTTELRLVKVPTEELLGTHQLEQLRYLAAVVQESLRCFPAVLSRFPRITRISAMQYGSYSIPANTIVGMSNSDVLADPTIFPDPQQFLPERWLDPVNRARLLKYQVPFLRGSRNCVGQNLAMAEMVLALGNVIRRYNMQLFETGERDIEIVSDCYVPLARSGSLGVRVVLKRVR